MDTSPKNQSIGRRKFLTTLMALVPASRLRLPYRASMTAAVLA